MRAIADPPAKPPPGTVQRRQVDRVRDMRDRLVAATVGCLDELGYAGASISAIQQAAGVSRGAILHHFPSRQALIAATAASLLEAAIRPIRENLEGKRPLPKSIADFLSFHWRRVVDTREGRAFVEILVACRTDRPLEAELSKLFADWDAEIAEFAQKSFRATGPAADDAALLWSIGRAFLRGLLIHARFVDDPAYLKRMVERFGELLASQLTLQTRTNAL